MEEIDAQEIPSTPEHIPVDDSLPFRSPGAASEMSGTTAISSFSMVEAEFLEPKFILKHLRKLCESTEEFLSYLAPTKNTEGDPLTQEETLATDFKNIGELQKPDSDYSEEYRDFDTELNVHLKHFKSDEHNYIQVRAIQRALFAANYEAVAAQTGLASILYLANLVIFVKTMIHSDRNSKSVWDALRQLDNTFPSQFMRSLTSNPDLEPGASALLYKTFELALELRTQLAILVLDRSSANSEFDADDELKAVFYRTESSQDTDASFILGWNIAALGGDEVALPEEFHAKVDERVDQLQECASADSTSQDGGVNLVNLYKTFPWEVTVLRLLDWARLRHEEIHAAIDDFGGATSILSRVKQGIKGLLPVDQTSTELAAHTASQKSPRKKRASFGRDRRRSSRKFDPNAPVDLRSIDALKARVRDSGADASIPVSQQGLTDQHVEQRRENGGGDLPEVQAQPDEYQPTLGEETDVQVEEQFAEEVEEPITEPNPSDPPTSSLALLKALKEVSNPQKENRPLSLFDRQATARRVEFGDGFDDSQPTPGPSNKGKGKEPVQASPKKRRRAAEPEEDSDDDAFEMEARGARVQEQRRKAPVAKKVRIDPSSSGAPPSHQPPRRNVADEIVVLDRQEESPSEGDAPEMTEAVPAGRVSTRAVPTQAMPTEPRSIYHEQKDLALQSSSTQKRDRKQPTRWSETEELAFLGYMEKFPGQYSRILQQDEHEGGNVLKHRTQVNLKDKARTMAIHMIK